MNLQPSASIAAPSLRRRFESAFTLVELLVVIAVIGLLAALLAPVLKHFAKPDVTVSATRQMLDDCARARQMAISQRSTVYMVFIPTNFWAKYTATINNTAPWNQLPVPVRNSTVVTQMYAAQLCGYYMQSLRAIGDQPGRGNPQDLVRVKTLPAGSFISQFKFTAPQFPSAFAPIPTNRADLPIYGFRTTNNILFPTVDVLTNAGPPNPNYVGTFAVSGGLTLPYIAFNYLGQLTPGDGTVLPYDENIPLSYGTISPAVNPASKAPIQGFPSVTENPVGGSTNISYNVVHIDRLTGRARVERLESL